jgi:hypothetical protein
MHSDATFWAWSSDSACGSSSVAPFSDWRRDLIVIVYKYRFTAGTCLNFSTLHWFFFGRKPIGVESILSLEQELLDERVE